MGHLQIVTGPDAARTDDALARIKKEKRIGRVDPALSIRWLILVTHFAQTNFSGHILQFAVTVG